MTLVPRHAPSSTLSRTLPLVVVITLFVATVAVAQPQPIDLGTLGGTTSTPAAINERSQVVGSSNGHAFLWTATTGMMDLGTPTSSFATAINNLGHVGGGVLSGDPFGTHPFLWTPEGGVVEIEPPHVSCCGSMVSAVNDVDQVVGTLDALIRPSRAFTWTSTGGMQTLGSLGGATAAVDVNNGGLVVGLGYVVPHLSALDPRHAFAWTESTGMLDLGTLGGIDSQAVDVNDAGQVVGWSFTVGSLVSCPPAPCIHHAFLWTATAGMVSLGTLGGTNSEATAVNADGWVVGQSDVTQGSDAFLWTPDHGMADLGTLGGGFSSALDVNDRGQVVGWSGTADSGVRRGFVWTAAGGMVELPPLPGYASSEARFVNNRGYIVGVSCSSACPTGNPRATLWVVPVKDDAQQQLADTIDLILSYNLTKLGTSLTDKLQNASNFVAAGQVSQACGTLTGFLHQVSAQKGKALTVVQAAALAARVIRIRNDIGC
jgi:Predicted integral membrane proteins containing uncharacterized repeats